MPVDAFYWVPATEKPKFGNSVAGAGNIRRNGFAAVLVGVESAGEPRTLTAAHVTDGEARG
jgi:hypothetical protein